VAIRERVPELTPLRSCFQRLKKAVAPYPGTMDAHPAHPINRQAHITHMLGQAPAWAAALWTRTHEALRAASTDLALAHDRQLLYQVTEALQARRPRLEQAFAEHLRAHVQGQAPGGNRPAPKDIHELSLVDESQAEREIEVSRTVQWIDLEADWELREMQAFAAMLPGAPGPLDGQKQQPHPLRPATFARALSDTVHELSQTDAERQMLLRLSGKALAGVLKQAYAAECKRLRDAGMAPKSFKAPSHARPTAEATPKVDATRPGMLSELLRERPDLSRPLGAPEPAPAQTASAAGGLNLNLDTDTMLRTLQRSLPPGGAAAQGRPSSQTHIDGAQAVALVGRMWAAMTGDAAMQAPVRALIGHLQDAALDLARRQPQVIDDPRHPMWRLLNHIAEAASGYARDDDAELQAFLAHMGPKVARVARQRPPHAADFADTQQHAEAFLEERGRQQLQSASHNVHQRVDALRHDDRRLALRPLLSQQIDQQMNVLLGPLLKARIKSGPDGQPVHKRPRLPASIPAFLTGTWVDVLTQAMSEDSLEADSRMQALLGTTEALLHSLQPPADAAAQQALRDQLPGLVAQVQTALAEAGVADSAQTAALDALMVVHTQYLRLPPRPVKPDPEDAAAPDHAGVDAPALRERPWGVDTDIGMLPTVPMSLMAEGQDSGAPDWLDSLQAGAWMKLQWRDQWCTARVLWISEHRAYLVIQDRHSGQLHSLTRGALSKLHEAGLATGLQERSLVQRTIDSLLQPLN
jgi:Protein of unknown function (DUF1631)